MVAREILIPAGHIARGRMATFLAICVALAVSSVYELHMFMALIGAGSALAVLARPHDRQMRRFVN